MCVFLDGVGDVERLLGLDVACLTALAEGYAVHDITTLVIDQFEFDVLLTTTDNLAGAVVIDLMGAEYGTGVGGAEGVETLEVGEEATGDVAETDGGLDINLLMVLRGVEILFDILNETTTELVDVFHAEGEAGRIGVPAKVLE